MHDFRSRCFGAAAASVLTLAAVASSVAAERSGVQTFDFERDLTFTAPGKAGVWTKADSVTWFDDLTIRPIGAP